ncbi:MAG TPA: zinc metalloprotease [Chitinophagaceae bacterium]|nr:zinc metalloprotease [Chitinophagaceae bacterium]
MKRLLLVIAAGFLLVTGCNKSGSSHDEPVPDENDAIAFRDCASHDLLEEKMNSDPALRQKMAEVEAFTRQALDNPQSYRLVDGVIEIPVVFNILYRTATENISDAQVNSQIDVLNEDFQATNQDMANTPAIFQPVLAGAVGVRFVIDQVNRKYSNKRSWSIMTEEMKFTSSGGLNAVDPATKLNIWVVNKMTYQGRTILGYAQFPGGNPATDGVVLGYNFTGRTGYVSSPYNKGRTATHEVGHWLNLRHIWGDATCGNDQVNDTPQHNTSNGGCPAYPHYSTCAGKPVEMTMNYMDYTYDACMYMFTAGQKNRMLTVFASGGARNSFAQP